MSETNKDVFERLILEAQGIPITPINFFKIWESMIKAIHSAHDAGMPENVALAQFHLGGALLDLGFPKMAKSSFERAIKGPLPDSLRGGCKNRIREITESEANLPRLKINWKSTCRIKRYRRPSYPHYR